MNTEALLMMVVTYSIITGLTAYFFLKVLFSKKHHEPDSYSEND
jgi:heme/copper-type cytochrome/quinol oxidase subunit 2